MTAHTSRRIEVIDAELSGDFTDHDQEKRVWKRVAAKGVTFREINFRYTIFEQCYFRECRFERCDFTGALFVDLNFRNSTFPRSKFDYARFTRTIVSHDILTRHLPGYENVQLELARSLRANYGQIGDTEGVNRAIVAELRATRAHYYKAAWSSVGYYRDRFTGAARVRAAAHHAWFATLDFVWGNGESPWRVARTALILVVALAGAAYNSGWTAAQAWSGAAPVFFGVKHSYPELPLWVVTTATALRFIVISLFVSVLVRRLARR